jgi:hypothetical protein
MENLTIFWFNFLDVDGTTRTIRTTVNWPVQHTMVMVGGAVQRNH